MIKTFEIQIISMPENHRNLVFELGEKQRIQLVFS